MNPIQVLDLHGDISARDASDLEYFRNSFKVFKRGGTEQLFLADGRKGKNMAMAAVELMAEEYGVWHVIPMF